MINFTAKLTKQRIAAIVFAIAIPLLFLASVTAVKSDTVTYSDGSTKYAREKFISSFGWKGDFENETSKNTTIPSEFNDVYTSYNEIQKICGYDLEQYKGKTVTLYSVPITNYDSSDEVFASILVYDDKIIGGDIHSTALDGFMHSFNKQQ